MNFFLSCILLAGALVSTDALMCWTCENVPDLAACRARGQLKQCRSNEMSCQDEFRRGSYGTLVFKKCKEPHACENNFVQNPRDAATPSQCNPGADTSVCRCCCFTDGCNSFTTDCIPPPTTRANPTTSRPVPTCNEPSGPNNGYVNCEDAEGRLANNRFLRGAECIFGCNRGFTLIGSRRTVCDKTTTDETRLRFIPEAPECRRCTVIRETEYLEVNCNDRNNVGSTCEFSCGEGRVIYPPRRTESVCQKDATWTVEPPCCLEPCPTLDLGLILDSSSSVRRRNWNTIIQFATQVIDLFEIGPDKGRAGVFRFNRNVDTDSAILLNRFTNNKDALIREVERIPYNGEGTRTGNALRYAYETFFQERNGDRPGSPNVLLVVTDGRGQDVADIRRYARLLQNEGVIIYAVAIIAEGANDQDELAIRDQLVTIAGSEDNVIRVQRGFEALDESIAAALGSQICSERACPAIEVEPRK